ncbi:MAG: spore coat protein [Eubacteriales bacterium]
MDDKQIMDNILTATKSACDLMMHGAIESPTPDVHNAFTQVFNDTLCMQNEIYKKMSEKGWYPMQQAEQQKIDAAKQKFAGK